MALKGSVAYGYSIPEGAVLELKQALELAPGHARKFIQFGKPLTDQSRDRFVASCNFEVRDLDRQAVQTIQPDQFVVTRVEQGYQQVVLSRPILVAGDFNHDGAPIITRHNHFWLSSANQPQVIRLSCFGAEGSPHEAYYPTQQEIQSALGEVATLRW
jgi:hypothetical protein